MGFGRCGVSTELASWEDRIKSQGRKKEMRLPRDKSNPIRRKVNEKPDPFKIGEDSEEVKPKIDRELFSSPAGVKYKTKKLKNVHLSKAIQQYIDVWNASLFPSLKEFRSKRDAENDKQTKTYKITIKFLRYLLSEKLFTGKVAGVRFPKNFEPQVLKIPPERFQYLIKNLEKKAFNSNYLPRNKDFLSKTTLLQFLVGNGTYGTAASTLLDHALCPVIPNTNMRPKNPKLSEYFKELYIQWIGASEQTLTFSDRNHLVGASNKYLDFFTQFQGSFEVYGYREPMTFLRDYYWKALSSNWKNIKKIPLSYLNSKAIVSKTLVPYFLKIEMLKDFDFEGADPNYWREK